MLPDLDDLAYTLPGFDSATAHNNWIFALKRELKQMANLDSYNSLRLSGSPIWKANIICSAIKLHVSKLSGASSDYSYKNK
jgi:hypothetical protein